MRGWVVFWAVGALLGCGGESKKTAGGGDDSNTSSSATSGDSTSSSGSDSTSGGPTGSGGTGTTGTTATTATGAGGGSGGTSTSSSNDTGSGGTSAGGGGDGGAFGGLACPTQVPDDGSSCDIETEGFTSAHCSWGDDPRAECRTRAVCVAGTWTVQEPFDTSCEEPPLPAACESEPPENGTACDEANLRCLYESGTRCVCSPCMGGSGYPVCGQIDPPEWWCTTPSDGCPVPAPQAGTACDDPDASCGHDCELPIFCQDGAWQYGQNGCPICAAPDTQIATPSGEQPIAQLRVGDLVYTVENGATVARPIVQVGSTKVRAHMVLRIALDSGATIEMSPGHPTADGRMLSDLRPGDMLDENHRVVSTELIPFDSSRTHDILPASRSGAYFASGALVGSTLAR